MILAAHSCLLGLSFPMRKAEEVRKILKAVPLRLALKAVPGKLIGVDMLPPGEDNITEAVDRKASSNEYITHNRNQGCCVQ